MKRSEMVDKIQILLENRGYVGNGDDGEAVVSLIEKLGMLPPRGELDISNPSMLKDALRTVPYLWEPEDERTE